MDLSTILIHDDNIEDISCDGVGIPIFVYHRKYGSLRTGVLFLSEDTLNDYVVALGQKCGKQISVFNPILDGTAPEGHRVQSTYSHEVTTRGSTFTIRRFKEKPWTPVDLARTRTASPEMLAYFWLGAEAGESMMICGGTASGKTSTLNAIALFIPPGSKIVSIEDTREINLPHENWVPSETRSGVGEKGTNGKADGEVDMYDSHAGIIETTPRLYNRGRGQRKRDIYDVPGNGNRACNILDDACRFCPLNGQSFGEPTYQLS